MVKVFLELRPDGTIKSVNKLPKAGRVEVDDTDPRVVALRRKPSDEDKVDTAAFQDPIIRAIVQELADQAGTPVGVMRARLKSHVRA